MFEKFIRAWQDIYILAKREQLDFRVAIWLFFSLLDNFDAMPNIFILFFHAQMYHIVATQDLQFFKVSPQTPLS